MMTMSRSRSEARMKIMKKEVEYSGEEEGLALGNRLLESGGGDKEV